jgi:hypothetical protein
MGCFPFLSRHVMEAPFATSSAIMGLLPTCTRVVLRADLLVHFCIGV